MGQAQMQMGLQALLLGRMLGAAADSFSVSVSALSAFMLQCMFQSYLLPGQRCSSADFEAACLPAQSLPACRCITCMLPSKICCQGPVNLSVGNVATCRMLTCAPGWAAVAKFAPATQTDRLRAQA